jgi:hypothetical protein
VTREGFRIFIISNFGRASISAITEGIDRLQTNIMIIDEKSIIVTLLIVAVAFVYGLKLIRAFALQIAQENHDAVSAMDQEEERQRKKKERDVDAAADAAYAHVEPILKIPSIGQPKVEAGRKPREESSVRSGNV